MKKNFKGSVYFLLSLVIACSGCSLFEKDIEAELSDSKFVNEDTQGENITYDDELFLDAANDKDIKDNLDKIKDWNVVKVSYSISGFQGDVKTTFSGKVNIRPQSATGGGVDADVTDINLQNLSNSGEVVELPFTETELAQVAEWFEEEQIVIVRYVGVLSNGPTSFTLTIYLDLKVKAKIL